MDAPSGPRRYAAGSIIFIDPDVTPSDGKAVLARLRGGEMAFKVFRQEAGRRWLQPLHPAFPVLDVPFEVLGVCVGTFTPE